MPSGNESNRCCPRPNLAALAPPGRKPLDNRAALTGILFIRKTGLAWNDPAARDGLRQRGGVLGAPARVAPAWSLDGFARAALG